MAGFDLLLNTLLKRPTMQLDDYFAYKQRRQAKFVIYTAISGEFDDLIQHAYVSKDADYVCYTDQVVAHPGIWEIRPLETKHLDRVRSARFYKVFPHELFPDVRYSVWIDGNIDVLDGALESSVDALILNKIALATNIHFSRTCSYAEALVCRNALLDDSAVILQQIAFLEQQQFPHNYGLFETNMMFRDHHQSGCVAVMRSWWDMIMRFSRRDQLSFGFALFQNQLGCEHLFPVNPRLGTNFAFKPHHQKMLSTLYVDTGSGFNEQDIWPGDGVISDGANFKVAFENIPFSAIKQVRFDPVDGQFCRLRLERIDLTFSSGQAQSVAFTEIEPICRSNGLKEADGMTAFETFDPHVTFPLSGDIRRLVVTGQIQLIHPGNKINALVERTAQAGAQHAQLTAQHADLLLRFDAATAHNTILSQSLVQKQHKLEALDLQVFELRSNIQAMLLSRTWRIGKAVLWLPKRLFKRG